MKKKILFGVIFSICLIMLGNSISAVEFKTVADYNNDLINSKLENFNNFFERFRQFVEELQYNSNKIKLTNEIKEISDELSDLRISIIDNPSLPTCIRTILGFIIGLLFSIIGTIFGIIFGPLLALFVKILTAPAVLLAKLIAFIVNLFTP